MSSRRDKEVTGQKERATPEYHTLQFDTPRLKLTKTMQIQ